MNIKDAIQSSEVLEKYKPVLKEKNRIMNLVKEWVTEVQILRAEGVLSENDVREIFDAFDEEIMDKVRQPMRNCLNPIIVENRVVDYKKSCLIGSVIAIFVSVVIHLIWMNLII